MLGTPTSIEAAKINNLLRTNPQRLCSSNDASGSCVNARVSWSDLACPTALRMPLATHQSQFFRSSLAQLIDFPVIEGSAPRSVHAQVQGNGYRRCAWESALVPPSKKALDVGKQDSFDIVVRFRGGWMLFWPCFERKRLSIC